MNISPYRLHLERFEPQHSSEYALNSHWYLRTFKRLEGVLPKFWEGLSSPFFFFIFHKKATKAPFVNFYYGEHSFRLRL